MRDPDTLPVLPVGRETLRLKNILEAVPILDVAHVAFGVVDARLLSEVTPVAEVCLWSVEQFEVAILLTAELKVVTVSQGSFRAEVLSCLGIVCVHLSPECAPFVLGFLELVTHSRRAVPAP
jgi:hypothetical protein